MHQKNLLHVGQQEGNSKSMTLFQFILAGTYHQTPCCVCVYFFVFTSILYGHQSFVDSSTLTTESHVLKPSKEKIKHSKWAY